MSRRETPSSLVLGRVAWSEFGRLGRSVLDPRVILTHAFLAYVPISIAVATGPTYGDWLPRASASIFYAVACGIVSCAVNDFFDRGEDLWYKTNAFDHDTATGLAFVVLLVAATLALAAAFALTWDWQVLPLTAVGVLIAWWYSDNLFMKATVGVRLKDHFVLEMLAMSLGYAAFFWASLGINGVALTNAWPLVVLVAVDFAGRTVKKDLADVAKDRRVGNMTIPVVFGEAAAKRVLDTTTVINCLLLTLFVVQSKMPAAALAALIVVALEIVFRRYSRWLSQWRYFLDAHPFFLVISVGTLLDGLTFAG